MLPLLVRLPPTTSLHWQTEPANGLSKEIDSISAFQVLRLRLACPVHSSL